MEINFQTIISQMTMEDKAARCTGASFWTTTPFERLGVPGLTCSDDHLGMGGNILDMINEIPLQRVLMFIPKSLPRPAEEMVEEMLSKAHNLNTN